MIDVHIKLTYPDDTEKLLLHCDDRQGVEQIINEFRARFPDADFEIRDNRQTEKLSQGGIAVLYPDCE